MDYLPVFLDVKGALCLVVGGSSMAARKVALLRRAGARVRVVAPALCEELRRAEQVGEIEYRGGSFSPEDLEGQRLVVVASNDDDVNRCASEAARRARVLVNVVDHPGLCQFLMPSIVDRSPVVIAISTSGAAPVLARILRRKLESLIPMGYGRLAALAGEFRDAVRARFCDTNGRRGFWEQVLEGPVAELVYRGEDNGAREMLEAALGEAGPAPAGEIYVIHVSHPDPELLCLKALRLMQNADVVVYEPQISEAVLDLVRRDAERIRLEIDPESIGQQGGLTIAPAELSQELSALTTRGQRVAVLKRRDRDPKATPAQDACRILRAAAGGHDYRWEEF